ncbi:MAG: hypothetical protein GY711_30360 [bacterium]|nr:hypothetical protein [bacterium]
MKRPFLGSLIAALALSAATGCQNTGQDINDHWNAKSIPPRAGRFLLGYNAEKDGDYRDFAWARKQNINTTMRRHLLHHNPDNPNHREVPTRFQERPRNSLLPNPWNYIHWEGILLGVGTLAGSNFIPIPVDSLIGTIEEGGIDEFMDGVGEAFTPVGIIVSSFANNWIDPPLEGSVTTFHSWVD